MKLLRTIACLLPLAVSGCAGLTFNSSEREGALTYSEPVPYLFVAKSQDCSITATVISLPGEKRSVSFNSGYGSGELSLELNNGIINKVGQKTDTKVPETLTAIAGLAKVAGPKFVAEGKKQACVPNGALFPIVNGVPSREPISLQF